MENLILWVLGIAGISVLLFKAWEMTSHSDRPYNGLRHLPLAPNLPELPVDDHSSLEQRTLNSKQKGLAFENFITELFDKEYFTIMEWRSDKVHKGAYAVSNFYPDMEWRYKHKGTEVYFAIECKWRKGFGVDNRIQWAKDYQLKNYKDYHKERKLKVFVLIGVGGEASNPEELYVIPLEEIDSVYLSREEMVRYKRYKASKMFFLGVERMRLE